MTPISRQFDLIYFTSIDHRSWRLFDYEQHDNFTLTRNSLFFFRITYNKIVIFIFSFGEIGEGRQVCVGRVRIVSKAREKSEMSSLYRFVHSQPFSADIRQEFFNIFFLPLLLPFFSWPDRLHARERSPSYGQSRWERMNHKKTSYFWFVLIMKNIFYDILLFFIEIHECSEAWEFQTINLQFLRLFDVYVVNDSLNCETGWFQLRLIVAFFFSHFPLRQVSISHSPWIQMTDFRYTWRLMMTGPSLLMSTSSSSEWSGLNRELKMLKIDGNEEGSIDGLPVGR